MLMLLIILSQRVTASCNSQPYYRFIFSKLAVSYLSHAHNIHPNTCCVKFPILESMCSEIPDRSIVSLKELHMHVPKNVLLFFQILYCWNSNEPYRQLNIWIRLMPKLLSQTFMSSHHAFSVTSFDKSTLTRWINCGPHSRGLCWLESLAQQKSIKKEVQWHFQSLWTIPSNRLGGSKPALCSPEYCSSHLFGSCSKLSNWKDWINLFILWIH